LDHGTFAKDAQPWQETAAASASLTAVFRRFGQYAILGVALHRDLITQTWCRNSRPRPMDDKRITVETIRLLLHVAWSDDDIAPEEYDYIFRMARNAGLTDKDILALDAAMRDRTRLYEPNIEILKPHREEVLAHVQALISADDHIAQAETEILIKIASLLNA
jgi:uncharacterized tellurite resistance protein B-like protein